MNVARSTFPWLLAVLALVGLLAGCAPRAQPEAAVPEAETEVSAPAFTILQARLDRYDPPGAGASARLRTWVQVINPNPYPLRLRPFDYTLMVDGAWAGRGRSASALSVPPRESAELELVFDLELSGQPPLLRQVAGAFAGTPLRFAVEAALELEALGGAWRFAPRTLFEGGARAAGAPEPPRLAFDAITSSVFLLESSLPVVRVVARAENPGTVGYLVYGSDLQLLLDGHSLAFGDLRPTPLPAGASARLELLFYPDAERLSEAGAQALAAVLEGGEAAAELRGAFTLDVFGLGSFPVPPEGVLGGPLRAR